jgi:hypothetical protein
MIGACPIDQNLLSCMAHYEPRTLLLIALGIVLVLITIFLIRTSTR